MSTDQHYFTRLAAAFVRGKLHDDPARVAHNNLFAPPLDTLTDAELHALIQLGVACELRMHKFKRTMGLARVQRVLGVLHGIQPDNLLDIGSGRGAFLWPLLDAFPTLPVTAVDTLAHRVDDIQAVCAGGVQTLSSEQGDVTALDFPDNSFDVVTMLEVLEHIPDTAQALAEVCRIARRFLVLSVPSRPDDNPEHIHLFSQQQLSDLLEQQQVHRVHFDYVHNHMITIAKIAA